MELLYVCLYAKYLPPRGEVANEEAKAKLNEYIKNKLKRVIHVQESKPSENVFKILREKNFGDIPDWVLQTRLFTKDKKINWDAIGIDSTFLKFLHTEIEGSFKDLYEQYVKMSYAREGCHKIEKIKKPMCVIL